MMVGVGRDPHCGAGLPGMEDRDCDRNDSASGIVTEGMRVLPPEFALDFLQRMDSYLCQNVKSITCDEIHSIYTAMFHALKCFRGNSAGFTGLSEFLILRVLIHLLGGSFRREQISKDLSQFVSDTHEGLVVGQSIPVTVRDRKYYPDILVQQSGELLGVCSIKIYPTKGRFTFDDEMAKVGYLMSQNPELRALLLVYDTFSQKTSRVRQHFEQIAANDPRTTLLVLKGNDRLLSSELAAAFALDRFGL